MSNKNKTNRADGINRREFIKIGSGGALLLAGGSLGINAFASPKNSTPNILLIITDQQHIDTVAAGGCRYVRTPALDQLKNRGFSFDQSHSTNPVCSPARSSIFTGRTTSETGVYVNGRSVRSDIPNLGQWFSQETDYETVYAGKWHVPKSYTHFIPGFNVLHTGISGQGNLGDTCASRACEGFLRNRSSSRPFFMVASFLQPHDICEWLRLNTHNPDRLRYPELADKLPPLPDNFEFDPREPDYIKQTRLGRDPVKGNWSKQQWQFYLWSYYRHIEMVDGEIGRLLQALQDTGNDRDTLILLTSDHGEGLGHHQMVRKSSPYDEAMKVPLFVSWPGHIPENKTDTTHLVSGLDIMPTLCEYTGIKPPKKMRGKSLRPLLEGNSVPWHPCVFTELNGNRARVVRTEHYKYITYVNETVEQLFDMQADPGETKNLAASSKHASALAEHKKLLIDWESRLDVAPNLPHADAWWRKG